MRNYFIFILLFLLSCQLLAQQSKGCAGNCFNGKGTYTWGKDSDFNGDSYSGEWQEGMFHGKGTYIWADGRKYKGEWENGYQQNYGIYYYSNGDRYAGNWVKGKKEGKGTLFYANGDRYEGEWKNNKEHGFGIYYWKSGDRFEGIFKNGVRHGHGKYIYKDGHIKEGEWKNGHFVDERIAEKGECISGNCFDGEGTLKTREGGQYEGSFKEGKYQGHGKLISHDGKVYNGHWDKGRFEGFGTVIYPDGKTEKGFWNNDEMIMEVAPNDKLTYNISRGKINELTETYKILLFAEEKDTYLVFNFDEEMSLQLKIHTGSGKLMNDIDLTDGNIVKLKDPGDYMLEVYTRSGTGRWKCDFITKDKFKQ